MTLAQRQRTALLDLMAEVGPFAPTNCDGWQTQDLAAHLYVREHRPTALPGIAMARFAALTERLQREALHTHGYLMLLERLRTPVWFMRPLDSLINASEYFVHHEDVLRPADRAQQLDVRDHDELWRPVQVLARRTQFAWGGRLVLQRTDTGAVVPMGSSSRPVHVSGTPGELLYFFSGRPAEVDVVGEPDARAALLKAVSPL